MKKAPNSKFRALAILACVMPIAVFAIMAFEYPRSNAHSSAGVEGRGFPWLSQPSISLRQESLSGSPEKSLEGVARKVEDGRKPPGVGEPMSIERLLKQDKIPNPLDTLAEIDSWSLAARNGDARAASAVFLALENCLVAPKVDPKMTAEKPRRVSTDCSAVDKLTRAQKWEILGAAAEQNNILAQAMFGTRARSHLTAERSSGQKSASLYEFDERAIRYLENSVAAGVYEAYPSLLAYYLDSTGGTYNIVRAYAHAVLADESIADNQYATIKKSLSDRMRASEMSEAIAVVASLRRARAGR